MVSKARLAGSHTPQLAPFKWGILDHRSQSLLGSRNVPFKTGTLTQVSRVAPDSGEAMASEGRKGEQESREWWARAGCGGGSGMVQGCMSLFALPKCWGSLPELAVLSRPREFGQ